MEIPSPIRTAAILYADDNRNVSRRTIIRKIIESIFVQTDNQDMSVAELVDEIHSVLKLEFTDAEIQNSINDSNKFEVDNNPIIGETLVRLSPARFSVLKEKEEDASIKRHINTFSTDIYDGPLTVDEVLECFNRYIYELLNTNIAAFKKLIGRDRITGDIAVDVTSFSPEQRRCINEFLNWDNAQKNKALFNVVSFTP